MPKRRRKQWVEVNECMKEEGNIEMN